MAVVGNRGDREFVVLPSAARTATPSPVDFYVDNEQFDTLEVTVDVTAVGVTPSLIVGIYSWDDASGSFKHRLTCNAISTVSTQRLIVGPSTPQVANLSGPGVLGRMVRVIFSHGNGVSITYSVGAVLT